MKCGICRVEGHGARRCPKRSDATVRVDVPRGSAEIVLRERLRPLIRACAWDENMLQALMLSCYLQGALDGQRPEVAAAMRTMAGEST